MPRSTLPGLHFSASEMKVDARQNSNFELWSVTTFASCLLPVPLYASADNDNNMFIDCLSVFISLNGLILRFRVIAEVKKCRSKKLRLSTVSALSSG